MNPFPEADEEFQKDMVLLINTIATVVLGALTAYSVAKRIKDRRKQEIRRGGSSSAVKVV